MFGRSKGHAGRMSAFTLIELLVVVLILSILMAVALPLYLNAISDSQRKTCRANMQSIANAEEAYKVSNASHAYTTDIDLLKPDLQAVPQCPTKGAGAYSVVLDTTYGFVVHCTDGNHEPNGNGQTGFAPGRDNQ